MSAVDPSRENIYATTPDVQSQLAQDAGVLAGVLDLLTLPLVPVDQARSKRLALHLSFRLEEEAKRLRVLATEPVQVEEGADAIVSGIRLALHVMAHEGFGPSATLRARARHRARLALFAARDALTRRPHLSPAAPARRLELELRAMSKRWTSRAADDAMLPAEKRSATSGRWGRIWRRPASSHPRLRSR